MSRSAIKRYSTILHQPLEVNVYKVTFADGIARNNHSRTTTKRVNDLNPSTPTSKIKIIYLVYFLGLASKFNLRLNRHYLIQSNGKFYPQSIFLIYHIHKSQTRSFRFRLSGRDRIKPDVEELYGKRNNAIAKCSMPISIDARSRLFVRDRYS